MDDGFSAIGVLRKRRGWTLRELGRRAGIDPGNLSRLERGVDRIGPKTAMRLARAFRVGMKTFYDIDRELEQ